MKKILITLFVLTMVVAPVAVFAQVTLTGTATTLGCSTDQNLSSLICRISLVLNKIIPVLMVLAVVIFIWGVIMYVISSDEEAKKKGRNRMIWGIIGLVVILGMWGLVKMIQNSLGIENTQNLVLPSMNTEFNP